MYAPPIFQPSRSEALAFVAARGFGTVCASVAGRPLGAAIPFCLDSAADGTPLIAFHLARRNPLLASADGQTPWLLAVNGPDAYVSADWYMSPDQVPTWLYQAVHLTGIVRPMMEAEMDCHLDLLSDRFEKRLAPKKPWTSSKMTAGRLDAMKKAIVGFVMTVEQVDGSFKLNQHKSEADRLAVSTSLLMQPDEASQTIGAQIASRIEPAGILSDAASAAHAM